MQLLPRNVFAEIIRRGVLDIERRATEELKELEVCNLPDVRDILERTFADFIGALTGTEARTAPAGPPPCKFVSIKAPTNLNEAANVAAYRVTGVAKDGSKHEFSLEQCKLNHASLFVQALAP